MRPRAFLTFLESVGVYSWKAAASWERHRVACWMLSSTSVTCPITPRWQLFELYVLQSQDSSSHSTGKLSSQHILCRAFALLRGLGHTVRMENDWIVCVVDMASLSVLYSHTVHAKQWFSHYFFNASQNRTPHGVSEVVCVRLAFLQLRCTFAFQFCGDFLQEPPKLSSVVLWAQSPFTAWS